MKVLVVDDSPTVDSVVGFTVDAVTEVLRVPQDSIEPTTSQETYIVGVATVDEPACKPIPRTPRL